MSNDHKFESKKSKLQAFSSDAVKKALPENSEETRPIQEVDETTKGNGNIDSTDGEKIVKEDTEETQVVRKVTTAPTNPSTPATTDPLKRKRSVRFTKIATVLGLFVVIGGVVAFVVWKIYFAGMYNVTLYQVGAQRNIILPVGGGGLIFPRQQLDIAYPVVGRVIAISVKPGDRVTPDQPLILLDSSQLSVAIKQAAADMNTAQSYLNSVSASGSAVNVAQAQQQYELARNRYNALLAQNSSALLQNGNIVSPMNGVVTAVNVNPGEVFAPNTPLLTIMDESTVVVRMKLPLSNLSVVKTGQAAIVTPSALPGLLFPGTVTSVIPQADPQTDTFEAWVSVVNKDNALLPGMSAFARIQSPVKAIAVPRLAVLYANGQSSVFVVRNQIARLQNVQVIGRDANNIFIGSGLNPGDQVVLIGIDGLQDGQHVRVTGVEK